MKKQIGEYKLDFEWNSYKIFAKPIVIQTLGVAASNRVDITGEGVCRAELNKEAKFSVDCTHIDNLNSQPHVYLSNMFDSHDETLIDMTQNTPGIFDFNYKIEKTGKIF